MHNDVMLTGTDIEKQRKSKGWSQSLLAEKVGVDQGTISKWEADKTTPSGPAQKLLETLLSDEGKERAA
jgi:putative transcriptional regulator